MWEMDLDGLMVERKKRKFRISRARKGGYVGSKIL